jgi:hypothetical protein
LSEAVDPDVAEEVDEEEEEEELEEEEEGRGNGGRLVGDNDSIILLRGLL